MNIVKLLDRLEESLNIILESEDTEDVGDVSAFARPSKSPVPRVYISDKLNGYDSAPEDMLVKFTRARRDYSGYKLGKIEKGETIVVPSGIPVYVTGELFPYQVNRILTAVYRAGYEGGTSSYKYYSGHGSTYRVFAWDKP